MKGAGLVAGNASLFLTVLSPGCDGPAGVTDTVTTAEPVADPTALKYSMDSIWVRDEGDGSVRLGITLRMYDKMTHGGDQGLIGLKLLQTGDEITGGEPFGSLESYKMNVDLISPVSGRILQTSDGILSTKDVYSEGWMLRVKLSRPEEVPGLLSYDEYVALFAS